MAGHSGGISTGGVWLCCWSEFISQWVFNSETFVMLTCIMSMAYSILENRVLKSDFTMLKIHFLKGNGIHSQTALNGMFGMG